MGNRKVRKHVELDEYHNHKYVQWVLRDSRSILSKNKSNQTRKFDIVIPTATVAAISPPTPPVIGAS